MAARKVAEAPNPSQQSPRPEWSMLREHVQTGIAASLAEPASWASDPDELRKALDQAVVDGLRVALEAAADRWADEVIGAGRYERSATRTTSRSGSRSHTFQFSAGPVTVSVPKPRAGSSRPWWVPTLKKRPGKLMGFMRELWVRGLSLRDLASVSSELGTDGVSHATVAQWVRDVSGDTLRWLNRPVRKDIRYLVLDAVYVPVIRKSSKKEPILVALGITADGHKEILDVLCAASESTDSWGTVLSRLKLRGLPVDQLELVITDGDEGLISAVSTHLPNTRRQRCTVHKVRNVVGRCSRVLKKTAPAEAAAIYKAPSRSEAHKRAQAFIAKYEESAPKVAAVVEDDLDACLAFFDFDATAWKSLRSTNALERTHRELRRKLREVGAMKADVNVTRIAVQVAAFVNKEAKDKPIAGFVNNHGRRR